MTTAETIILDHEQIRNRINRIAYQIFENNLEEKEIILAGIAERGFTLARLIADKLAEIAEIKVILLSIQIDKKNPLKEVIINHEAGIFKNRAVVVIDDVLNTGKTLIYGLQPILQMATRRIQVAVLVDRNHRSFPVAADYIGLSLATTFPELVTVKLPEKGKWEVILS
jgi:pyrimidine operon attenuation protein/uracil phosphoribosyltransferase